MSRTRGDSRTAGTSARRTSGNGARASGNGARGRPRRRSRGGPLLVAAKVVAAVLFAAVVGVGLLYVRLMHGPVTLNFLVSSIESGIADELPGAGVSIESVALRLSESGLLQFELKNVRVHDKDGVPLVAAPSAAVSLSRRALLSGRIAAESLDLMSARLRLFYSEDGTLSLKFSPPADATDSERTRSAGLRGSVDAAAPATPGSEADWALGRIDLVKVLSEASARARRREHASAYLREIGLRSATVTIDQGNRKSIWRVPEFDLDLDHRRSRSAIAGRAKIESLAGPWELNFRSYEHINAKALNLMVSVQGVVPRGLARSFPQLAGLEGLDLPIWGDAKLELATTGELLSGKIVLDVAPGHVSLPWLAATPMGIDSGHIELSYDGAARRFEIAPSVLSRGDSRVQFAGTVAHMAHGPEGPGWVFDLKSIEASIAGEPPGLARLPIDELAARGFVAPERGRAVLYQLLLKAAGTEMAARGDVSDMNGATKVRLDGKIGAMPVAVFKSLWPGWVAPGTRAWVAQRLVRGKLEGGAFRVGYGSGPPGGEGAEGDRLSLALEGSNLEFALAEGWPALEIPRGLLRVEGPAVEFAAPEASVTAADGRKLALKASFSVDLNEAMPRTGRIAVRGQGPLSTALEFIDQQTLLAWQEAGITLAGVEGKLEGNANVSIPLTPEVQLGDARIEGKLRISDGKLRQVHGQLDAQAINVVVDMTPSAAEATAEFLIKGVPGKASWQHVYGAAPDKQPPLRITATLDSDQRAQLGLDINDLVQGDVGVEVTVASDAQGERHVHFRADLANAELTLDSLAWRKPKGRPSTFECDFAKGSVYPIELRNVRLVGDNVAMAGWMGAGADFRVREFRFPQFSLNVISVLEAHGKLRADNVLEVTAKGPTFDGRELFQSFFDINLAGDRGNKHKPGLDLRAEVDTVVGFYETNLRGVKLSMQKRAGKMTQLDMRGSMAGNKQFEASVRPEPGRPRLLSAKSNDAGQVFKLVGFYPHAVSGDMALEVNLDGQGVAERTGTLTASRFHVLGDTVTVQNLPNTTPGERYRRNQNVVRERFEFDTLRAPFSVGHGQFVLHNAAIEGPLVSATMRGKVDFRTRLLQVGGTFTPLSSLNKLFSGVPLVGDIVTGPRREGVFAMTYALQGGLENPQLIVNPFSAITPGITRELMQITPQDPRVVPRDKPGAGRNDGAPRSSSSPAAGPGGNDSATSTGPSIGGAWSADTAQPDLKK